MFKTVNSLTVAIFLLTLVFIKFTTSSVILRNSGEVTSDSDDSSATGLYYGYKKVEILNNTNFNNKLFREHKEKLWFVEFYSHWCGYCIRFVPVMKAFASQVYNWRDMVKVGTVDCANSVNIDICRRHEIKKYPSIRIFPPNSKEDFVGMEFGKGSETSIAEMREKLVLILKSYHNSQEKISGPVNLKLLRHDSLDRLWNEVPPTAMYLMLVFEPKDSLIGSQVALDVSIVPEVRLRLVDPKNKNLSRLVHMEEETAGVVVLERNPHSSVRADEPNDTHQTHALRPEFIYLSIGNFTMEEVNKAVRKFLTERGVDIALDLPDVHINHTDVSVDKIKEAIKREEELKLVLNVKHLSTVVFQMDLEAAIAYALTSEVTLVRNITAEQLDVLKNFINVIIKYFPTGEQGRRFFTELKEKELDDKDFVCGEDIRKTFKELEEKHKPFMSNLEWVGCRGTIPSLRGYPCSLWTLFHTLVAQEELLDRNIPDEKPEALNAIAGYVKYFFSCGVCSEHFTKMAQTIAGNVTTQRDAVMWLWRAHNKVNRRLAGDETEDPRHHKVQFPTVSVCPSCFTDDGSWDQAQVFTFLSNMFTKVVHFHPNDLLASTTTSTLPQSTDRQE